MNSSLRAKHPVRLYTLVHLLLAAVLGTGCDSSTNPTTISCATGAKRCSCYADNTCDKGLTCISDVCVASNPQGAGGSTQDDTASGGTTSVGGSTTATAGGTAPLASGGTTANSTGGTEATTGGTTTNPSTGGANAVGAGGVPATGGSTPIATGGSPPAPVGGNTSTATGGSTSISNSPIIDAFASCDDRIENNGGRSGKWYYFADSDFNATHAFGDPGTQWADHGCAAWMILGCTGTACTYAGLGLQLANGNPYDVSAYDGVSVAFEGKDDVYFTVKTSDGGYFGTWIAGTTGNQTRNVDFADLSAMANSAVASLNTRLVTELQFTVGKTLAMSTGFGLAIHSVSLR